MQQQPSVTGRQLIYVGTVRRRAIYAMREQKDGIEVYRDGLLIKSGLCSMQAALDCARADETTRP